MSNIVFVNWHTRKNTLNGPANVFESLVGEISKNEDITVISPEKGFKEFSNIIEAFKAELSSKEGKSFYINADGLKLPLKALMFSKLYRRHRFFLICHGIRKEEDKIEGLDNKKYYLLEGFVLKSFQNIITVSNLTKALIVKNYKRNKPTYVIYNGIKLQDTERLKVQEVTPIINEIKLMASGGLKRIKGIETMVEMVKIINGQKGEFRVKLDIYGSIDDDKFYEEIMKSIEGREDIVYGGVISKERLFQEYSKAHFTLSLSKLDSFNMGVLEGMAYGAPPILNERVGAVEVIEHNIEGFVVDEKNIMGLYNFFEEIYKNKEKYSIMVRKCYLKAEKYTWKKALNEYIALSQDVSK